MTVYHAKKRLGQHFLKSASIINRIINVINPQPDDLIVEIGPGRGALTLPLAKSGCNLAGVEFDRDLIGYLEKLLRQYDKVEIIHGDFLEFIPDPGRYKAFTLIGNIPYNLSAPVIEWLVEYKDQVQRVVLLVQKEIGERLSAEPGSRNWSPISIFTQLYYNPRYHFDVSPKHFKPVPQVMSALIEFRQKEGIRVKNRALFTRVVKASFKQRRKLLINNLVPEIISQPEMAREIMNKMGIDKKTRAEEVPLAVFLELTDSLIEYNII